MTETKESIPAGDAGRWSQRNERRVQWFGRLLLWAAAAASALLVVQLVRGAPELVERARLVETRAREKYRPKIADRIAAECRKSRCDCAAAAARAGLDLDLGNEVLAIVDLALAECPAESGFSGMGAEARVRSSRAGGLEQALQVLEREPDNPHAHYAVALAKYRAGQAIEALESLRRAIETGRGAEAHLLAGLTFYGLGRLDGAEMEFGQALRISEDDPAALYNVALVLHQQGRFAQARETYLKVLRVHPKHADARFNLAVLAHSLGALDEAKHHLRKFKELGPADEALRKLETIVATPVPEAPKLAPPVSSAAPPPAASAAP